jgi:hypothetical protein
MVGDKIFLKLKKEKNGSGFPIIQITDEVETDIEPSIIIARDLMTDQAFFLHAKNICNYSYASVSLCYFLRNNLDAQDIYNQKSNDVIANLELLSGNEVRYGKMPWVDLPKFTTTFGIPKPTMMVKKACVDMRCSRCNEFSSWAEPNQPDGSFKCYNCRGDMFR